MNLQDHRRMPPVGAAMTPFPYFVDAADSVEKIERLMSEHQIRHVPVQQKGEVIGIVSERDLHQLVHRALPRSDKARIRARDVLTAEPYVAEINMPLAEVVAEMAKQHLGSAVILKHGKLAGILSVTDVCRVLAEILESYFSAMDGGDAA